MSITDECRSPHPAPNVTGLENLAARVDPWSPRVSAVQRAALPPGQPDESPEVAQERNDLNRLFDPAKNSESGTSPSP